MKPEGYKKLQIPDDSYLEKWQQITDLAARLFDVPAGLIMRVWPTEIEVLIASKSGRNPYEAHEKADMNTGLYCETVMATVMSCMSPTHWRMRSGRIIPMSS